MSGWKTNKVAPKVEGRTDEPSRPLQVGIDVGSTTVKVVARPVRSRTMLYHAYRRHEGRQAETVLELLRALRSELAAADCEFDLRVTGSGGQAIAETLGARYVQEVAATSAAIGALHPDVRSAIELGGQDAKIILLTEPDEAGRSKKIATMNDKCAGGTGVVVEKIASRLHIPLEELRESSYEGLPIHPVAGKCGVFAETDIASLQKQGVPAEQLMASLFHAIVLQNLSVLTRGHTLRPPVLLLGGPNRFFPGLRTAWRAGLTELWQRKMVALPEDSSLDKLIRLPEHAELYAAIGAIEYYGEDAKYADAGGGIGALEDAVRARESSRGSRSTSISGLWKNARELEEFRKQHQISVPQAALASASSRRVFLGIDGGSTSTKAVALDEKGELVASAYRLSEADPVADAVAVLRELQDQLTAIGSDVEVQGLGATGYSRSLLGRVLGADVELVETVAHAKSSLRIVPEVEAIIDVGGQDIKIILLRHGAVRDFKLNTQCSAGNGYFLQAAANQFGVPVEEFAETAFRATRMPEFSYGCAVFLQSDIVNFQRQGWQPEEILAGLAAVLPKNVFLYVAGISNTSLLGRRFVLQGGTQRNLAVVKAETDFIREHYFGEGAPEITVHPHAGVAGAIGAALEARDRSKPGRPSRFSGFASLDQLHYTIRRDESTRCGFCANRCMRTFVEVDDGSTGDRAPRCVVVATCERGEAADAQAARRIQSGWTKLGTSHPNYVSMAGVQAWQPTHPPAASAAGRKLNPFRAPQAAVRSHREKVRIGIPRVLSMYTYAPLFSAYFESLGVPAGNLRYSHFSDATRYAQAAGFLSVDPCYPSKVVVAHVYELLESSRKEQLDAIFLPMFDELSTPLQSYIGASACPSGAATPEGVKAAFSRSRNWFEEARVQYLNPLLDMSDRSLFKFQMFTAFRDLLKLNWDEHGRAVEIAFAAWEAFEERFRSMALDTMRQLERDGEIGLVLLGRPYHHDPGLNQGILDELQRKGYPIFSQSLLPLDGELLDRLFGDEVRMGITSSPLDISDVWKHSFSASSNHKLWAAKFVARCPNLISVELSNFKCGHDAFIARTIERIVEQSGKPHFSFRDLDENRPLASIRIRVETIDYFLRQYRERLQPDQQAQTPPMALAAAQDLGGEPQ